MCGIAGVFLNESARENKNLEKTLRRLCIDMSRRGPDNQGCWVSKNKKVGLHNRLSIIDLKKINQ